MARRSGLSHTRITRAVLRRSRVDQARRRLQVLTGIARASWLNQVERWFGVLTERALRRAAHRSTRDLEEAIRRYLRLSNTTPHPFIWTKTPDEILPGGFRLAA